MVLTDDDELAYRAQLLSNHGRGRTTRTPTTRSSSATTTG
jgi:dTDP-4-amino-4,6-dideoxygalactose transaminase